MKKGFFSTAWRDVRSSANWLRTVLVLALVGLIPIVGPVATLGLAYGWARDLTWGLRTPLPPFPSSNLSQGLNTPLNRSLRPDPGDNPYKRGLRLFTLELAMFSLPFLFGYSVDLAFSGNAPAWFSDFHFLLGFDPEMVVDVFAIALCYVFVLMVIPFILVGWMRITIYGRISAGFQIGRVWPMVRYRPSSLLRISGMVLLVFLAQLAMALIMAMVVGLTVVLQFAVMSIAGNPFDLAQAVGGLRPLALPVLALLLYAISVLHALGTIIIARAMGYWTAQFDVPHWLGQDDPMPFERHGVAKKAGDSAEGDGRISD